MAQVRAEHLYKIFGRNPEHALARLRAGVPREEVRSPQCTPAVIDTSFEVNGGEIFVVMGLSGSGKSTLIRMINGLLTPTAGDVIVDDDNLTALPPKELRRLRAHKISMVFQHFALFPHRSVLDNASYGLEVQGVAKAERGERAAESLRLVGLEGWEGSRPHQLSGGMQQRVGLARALATNADVLLMDEAFSALDPLIRREMQDQLIELQNELRKTIVFITHDLNEAMRLGDRIAVMRDGRIVQVGTAEDILNDPANDYVASFVQDVDRSRVLTAASVMEDPVARLYGGEGPHAALRVMREEQVPASFVVGRDRTLLGAVSDEAVAQATRDGVERLDELINLHPVTISGESPIVDVLTPAAESGLPIAVVDEQNRLLGVIPRVTLLAALGGAESAARSDMMQDADDAAKARAEAFTTDGTDDAQGGSGPAGEGVDGAIRA